MLLQDKLHTINEYEQYLRQQPGRRFELINGEIIEKMPTQLHGYIIHVISGLLYIFLKDNPIGYTVVEARYRIPGDDHNDRIPDLSFISKDKGPLVETGPALYMPDLAVEVKSPDQSDRLMSEKATYYLANGTRMVWLIYPDRRIVEVLTPDERHLLNENGTIDGGAVLPGFSVAVRDLFPA